MIKFGKIYWKKDFYKFCFKNGNYLIDKSYKLLYRKIHIFNKYKNFRNFVNQKN